MKGDEKLRTFSFDYDGVNSTKYSLMIGGLSISEDIPLGLSREILAGGLNRYRYITKNMGTTWSDTLQFEISFVKSPCEFPDDESMVFTEYEVNEIAAWLTSPDYPALLKMYDDDLDTFTRYEYFGLFNNIESQTFRGDIIGLTCTFKCNSPFAWTSEKSKSFQGMNGDNDFSAIINVESAERKRELYPIIEISTADHSAITGQTLVGVGIVGAETSSDGISLPMDVAITGITDGNKTLTMTIKEEGTIILDCLNYMIYKENGDNLSFEDIGVTDITQFYWPKLYNGSNEFAISGDVKTTIKWREPRKVGVY